MENVVQFRRVERVEQVSRIWSLRRSCRVDVRVEYHHWLDRGCRVICLNRLTDLS